jgi:hypothetical protein
MHRTFGDYTYTLPGFILTLLGTFLAALKTLMTGILQSQPTVKSDTTSPSRYLFDIQCLRLGLHPYALLTYMSPLAFLQCLTYAHYSGELALAANNVTRWNVVVLIANGAIAFALNVVSFTANKKTSALTMSIAGKRGCTPASWEADISCESQCQASDDYIAFCLLLWFTHFCPQHGGDCFSRRRWCCLCVVGGFRQDFDIKEDGWQMVHKNHAPSFRFDEKGVIPCYNFYVMKGWFTAIEFSYNGSHCYFP